jgi:acetyl esterase/lipase
MKQFTGITFLLIQFMISTVFAQQTIPLYGDKPIPNSKPINDEEVVEYRDGITIVSKISRPTLSIFLPENRSAPSTAVIICPGGGYWINAISHEGTDVAKVLNEWGVAAIVLKYRIPDEATMTDKRVGPLQDAQTAIAFVRKNAKQYGIDPDKIGIMGFSAGGHLASTAGTHFDKPVLTNTVSVRPDFMVLIYPVISFASDIGHLGSRDKLLGSNPDEKDVLHFSNEKNVSKETPPSFLVHARDDDAVNVENTLRFYAKLKEFNIPADIHLYEKGGHGFGMYNKTSPDLWMDHLRSWMITNGWLKNK